MPDLSIPGFERRYVLIPMLVAMMLIVVSYIVTEQRRASATELTMGVRDRQERLRELADLTYSVVDAESIERRFLLTMNPDLLIPFEGARQRVNAAMADLLVHYSKQDTEELPYLTDAERKITSNFSEMENSIKQARLGDGYIKAPQPANINIDLRWMEDLRSSIEAIRSRELDRVSIDVGLLGTEIKTGRYVAGIAVLLNVVLLLIVGVLITWEIERRNTAANKLNVMVEERTAELTELSTHMLNVREDEKRRLARELHDELGALLVSMKMDLAQLAKKFDFKQPDVATRWQRIQSAITSGVELKRRVIEELRPTLLDNLGLVAAIRWQCEETCSQANIALTSELPSEELTLDTNTAIAVFRVVQETLINIVKHAHATAISVSLKTSHEELLLAIEDNGIGLGGNTAKKIGSHGLLSIKHRMHAIGGTLQILPAVPNGTKVVVRVALKLANAMAGLD